MDNQTSYKLLVEIYIERYITQDPAISLISIKMKETLTLAA